MAVGVKGLTQIFSRLPVSLQRAQPSAMLTCPAELGCGGARGGEDLSRETRGAPPRSAPGPSGTAGMGDEILPSRGRGCLGRAVRRGRRAHTPTWCLFIFECVAWHQLCPRSPASLSGCCRKLPGTPAAGEQTAASASRKVR